MSRLHDYQENYRNIRLLLSAREAQSLGVVNEVLPANQLLPRAWELATVFAKKPPETLRYTRLAFTQVMKRRLSDELGYGLALEGLAMCAANRG